jgi:hypothetical protein
MQQRPSQASEALTTQQPEQEFATIASKAYLGKAAPKRFEAQFAVACLCLHLRAAGTWHHKNPQMYDLLCHDRIQWHILSD